MNPMTNVKNITKLNEIELANNVKKSWHDIYKDSAWIFIGGLSYGLTEGDILAVFSQYGEVVNINLVRDKKTGKTKGFCFLCYANQKSTVLAVDNFNGIKLCNRTIRVDHVANYKPPKEDERDDELSKMLKSEGCAPKLISVNESKAAGGLTHEKKKKVKKQKKEKKEKKKKKRQHKTDESDADHVKQVKIKEEKHDPGYDKYDTSRKEYTSEKELHQERSNDKSFGEHSALEKHRSEIPVKFYKHEIQERTVQHRSYSPDEERSKNKRKQKFSESTKHNKTSVAERKWYKRYSSCSSSSDDSSDSSSSEDDKKHSEKKLHSHKRADKNDRNNFRNENSASDSSPEMHTSLNKKQENENYKSLCERRASKQHRNINEHGHRRDSSDDKTTRINKHSYNKDERYSDHTYKSNYKDEGYSRSSSSHKRDKQDRR